jgi:hypothetical protein
MLEKDKNNENQDSKYIESLKPKKYPIPFISRGYKGKYYLYYVIKDTNKRVKKTLRTRSQELAIKILNEFKKKYNMQENLKQIVKLSDLEKR